MTKSKLITSIPCPFLSHIAPSQLVSLLSRCSEQGCSEQGCSEQGCSEQGGIEKNGSGKVKCENNNHYFNPIWLHNKGQNVIGFLPQTAFYLLAPTNDNPQSKQPVKTSVLKKTASKKSVSDKANDWQLLTLSRKSMSSFFDGQPISDSSDRLDRVNEPKNCYKAKQGKISAVSALPYSQQGNFHQFCRLGVSEIESSHDTLDNTLDDTLNSHNLAKELQLTIDNGKNVEHLLERLIRYMSAYTDDSLNTQSKQPSEHKPSSYQHGSYQHGSYQHDFYQHGLMGFIGYDVMANHLANQPSKQLATNSSKQNEFIERYFQQGQPTAYFAHYPLYLTCDIDDDKVSNQQPINHWQLHACTPETLAILPQVQDWLQQVITYGHPPTFNPPSLRLQPVWDKSDYQYAFDKTQAYLYAGDCYQINLTQSWRGQIDKSVRLGDYLPKLHSHTNAPFAGYLYAPSPFQKNLQDNPQKNPQRPNSQTTFELLSCSPELFFTFDKEGTITTKPIKGTRPRGQTKQEDKRLKDELANSEKDLAENVMIVDLLRNDLGKYAKTGTVKVPKRFAIESFSNVHHMVSTITATIKDDVHPLEVLFASLPVGSITGTPKKRAVQIINELESHAGQPPRGAYCGTMGYLNFDGSGQWNVLIRSLQANDDGVSLWAGGGITVASDCDCEYQECFDKVGNILQVLAGEN